MEGEGPKWFSQGAIRSGDLPWVCAYRECLHNSNLILFRQSTITGAQPGVCRSEQHSAPKMAELQGIS